MLKAFMASALIVGSTLTMSAPVMAQTQQSIEATSYQVAQRRGSAYVCTGKSYGYLRLRAWPSLRSRIIGRINNGEYLTILRSKGNWYRVNYQSQIGWVSGDFLCGGSPRGPVEQPRYTPRRYDAYVCTRNRYGRLNLRTGPARYYGVIREIPNGSAVKVLDSQGNWFQVRYRRSIGWVRGDFLCN